MPNPPLLSEGCTYHVYNRGNAGDDIFVESRNYAYFLEKYAAAIWPVADTYAYCLLRNHFHVLIRTLMPEEQRERTTDGDSSAWRPLSASRQFGALFGSYALGYNKTYERTGSLFEHPFRRIRVESEAHLYRLVVYIDRNAQHHGFVADFREWRHSSYHALASTRATRLRRDVVLDWFGGVEAFVAAHEAPPSDDDVAGLVVE
ncbi:MAG: hypothetical protein MUF84_12345 [Anaerolineae bacterium]|nr:hypothetical protein [Anaerolineae bacterium]